MRVALHSAWCGWDLGRLSDAFENSFFRNALVCSNAGKNRIQRPDMQRCMCRDGNPVGRRLLGLQNDVAANLMNSRVLPLLVGGMMVTLLSPG